MRGFIDASAAKPDILTDADLDATSIVVDAGAFIGEWAGAIVDRYHSQVYAFEPSPTSFAQLDARLGSEPCVRLFNVGLGGSDHTAELLDPSGPGATIGSAPPVAAAGQVRVEVRDVAPLLDELGIDRIDLLKVNIEGAEFDLFDRLIETGWLPRIETISVQFHEWHPDAHRRRRRIRQALAVDHTQVWCYPWVWELWTRR